MTIEVFKIDEHEVLPLELWRHLVKRRASYRCERCNATKKLHAHHINDQGVLRGGDHRLCNGECLCLSCHNLARSEPVPVIEGRAWIPVPVIDPTCTCGRALSDQAKPVVISAAKRLEH